MATSELSYEPSIPDKLVPEEDVPIDGEDESSEMSESQKRTYKKKRDASQLRKAPQAPKRFKSSYICFFMAKQPDIKEELGDGATVTEISKRSAEMWRNLSADKRAHWDDVAAKDKERYLNEKASYKGPWQVPWKRAKKDPSAPKRPMSAFLYFSQGRRKKIKDQNPEIKNTQVSRMLGEMWRSATEAERRPYIEKEQREREKYKVAIAEWRKDFEAKKEEQRQQQEAQQAIGWPQPVQYGQQEGYEPINTQPQYTPHPAYAPAPSYASYPTPYGYAPSYPSQPNYQYPVSTKQPVILGPNGMPHYQQPAQQPLPPPIPQQYAPPPPPPPPQQMAYPAYDEGHSVNLDPAHYDFAPDHFSPEPPTAE